MKLAFVHILVLKTNVVDLKNFLSINKLVVMYLIKTLILKHVLLNAVEFGGKANTQAVMGKLIAERPELRKDIKNLIKKVEDVVKEINSWGLERQKEKLDELDIRPERKEEKRRELPSLPNAKMGKVVTAFPPEPSKYPHIGHAKSAFVNFLYAKKYKGKFILRFEDTNPRLSKKEYYEAILNGLKWLEIKWDDLDYISDHIERYYEVTEKLINNGNAYICTCNQKTIKKNRRFMKECECRNTSVKENFGLWNDMLKNLEEGKASVRLRISMQHPNAAMRDPTIMRIIDHSHPRTGKKYRVWPMYDFGTALMDGWEGVTHRIRSKEFEMRTELQHYIQNLLGLNAPWIGEIARFNLSGVPSSGRKIREMIKNKELLGWDDPRLTTLIALKRRGFVPKAVKDFLMATGISKTESVLTWSILESFNRRVVDSIANRFFSVLDPIKIKINQNAPRIKEVKAPLHPDFPRGKRKIPVDMNNIYISRDDLKKYRGKNVRLINLFNVKLNEISRFVGKEIVMNMAKIQWVSEPHISFKIIMPDGVVKQGIGEPDMMKLRVDDIIQLTRIGFARIDQIKPELTLYFTHK